MAVGNDLWATCLLPGADEGKLHLCAVKDAWSNRIVGYSLDQRMTSALAVAALGNAVKLRGTCADTIVHSDRGGQFRSMKFTRALANARLQGSIRGGLRLAIATLRPRR